MPRQLGAGYFDSATHHKWSGTYSSGLGVEITSVLGETHKFSAKGFYWGIWVNNTFASAGLCDLKLKPGDQLLFAPAPGSGTTYPIILTAPATAQGGPALLGQGVLLQDGQGQGQGARRASRSPTPAPPPTATAARPSPSTKPGKVTLVATLKGYIRAEATVNVSQ